VFVPPCSSRSFLILSSLQRPSSMSASRLGQETSRPAYRRKNTLLLPDGWPRDPPCSTRACQRTLSWSRHGFLSYPGYPARASGPGAACADFCPHANAGLVWPWYACTDGCHRRLRCHRIHYWSWCLVDAFWRALDCCDCCPEDSPGLQVPPGYYCHLGDFAPVYLSNQQGILMLPSSFSPTRCRPSQFARSCVFSLFFFIFSLISYLKTSTLPACRALLGLGPAYPCLLIIVHWTDTKRGGGCARSAGGAGRQGCIDQVPVPVRVPACSCWRASASAGCRRASILPPLLPPLVRFFLFFLCSC
jgi:hypothetical protein